LGISGELNGYEKSRDEKSRAKNPGTSYLFLPLIEVLLCVQKRKAGCSCKKAKINELNKVI
jgi:hypothetical protein